MICNRTVGKGCYLEKPWVTVRKRRIICPLVKPKGDSVPISNLKVANFSTFSHIREILNQGLLRLTPSLPVVCQLKRGSMEEIWHFKLERGAPWRRFIKAKYGSYVIMINSLPSLGMHPRKVHGATL